MSIVDYPFDFLRFKVFLAYLHDKFSLHRIFYALNENFLAQFLTVIVAFVLNLKWILVKVI